MRAWHWWCLGVFVCLAAGSAQAAPFRLTFTGTVAQSIDTDGTFFGRGIGENTIVDLAVVQEFYYDTDFAPSDYYNGSQEGFAQYFGPGTANCRWLRSSTTIGGVLMPALPDGSGPPGSCDSIEVLDTYVPGVNVADLDRIQIDLVAFGFTPRSDGLLDVVSAADHAVADSSVIGAMTNLTTGIGLDQTFEVFNLAGAFASIDRARGVVSPDFETYIEESVAHADFNFSSVRLERLNTVPEPQTLALLCLAAIALAMSRRSTRDKQAS